jgi:hypothetical protein
MPTDSLDPRLLRRLRDRQGLLWVCQPYDLLPEASPHDYRKSPEEVRPLYRPDVSGVDQGFAGLYWEAVWLEGADSPILRAVRAASGAEVSNRRPVVLAGAEDAEAVFSEHQFLPVCILPGLLDPQAAPGARYGGVKDRVRRQIALTFAKRIERYPHRVLVVLGARGADDLLGHLYPALEDNRIVDLDLVVVQEPGAVPLAGPDTPAVRLHVWHRTAESLLAAMTGAGVPSVGQPLGWTVRVKAGDGKTAGVVLSPDAIQRVLNQFVLITEDDLQPPRSFTLDDLTSFFSGTPDAWAGYAAGLPVPRNYSTAKGRSLPEELLNALRQVEEAEPSKSPEGASRQRAATLTLPCAGGSGATTLLRAAAFQAAGEGYPTLLLRPAVTEVDTEVLIAFATSLSEQALKQGVATMPPLAIVLDAEVGELRTARQLAGTLAAQGRATVVLRAVQDEDRAQQDDLLPLRSETTQDEARLCEETFRRLVRRWGLPVDQLPTLEEWLAYESRSRWITPTGGGAPASLFWVALRFFLTGGLGRAEAQSVHDALGRWIAERDERVSDEGMRRVLRWVAALSSQRIVCPLMVALRPVTGGAFSSLLVPTLRHLGDLVDWQDFSPDFGDYAISFRHPALGAEYLRLHVGQVDQPIAIRELAPVLRQLVPGLPADRWLAERLVTEVLTPAYQDRQRTDWDWRLAAFAELPPALATDSRPILHHWARCLYQSADPRNVPDMPPAERRRRFETAIQYLRRALQLPRRQPREEHPSHLWNTLGVACSRLARFLDTAEPAAAAQAWGEAWEAFRKAIDLLPGNVEAILAFSHRLLDHAGVFGGHEEPVAAGPEVDEVARALSLLDEAEELIEKSQDPDRDRMAELKRDRAHALRWLGQEKVAAYLEVLKASPNPELGYYCEAQLVAQHADTADGLNHAIGILERVAGSTPLSPRSLRLLISLLRKHPARRYEFQRLLEIHEQLEQAVGTTMQPVEQFRHAVLYFQVGESRKGDARFRRLRELERRGDLTAPAVRELWRWADRPTEPRPTQVRVSRLISEWRAEGYVDELGLMIPLRPRHFKPMPRVNDVVPCFVRFEFSGPLAIPKRFVTSSADEPSR